MSQDSIFIHVPKTGGTTINCLIQGSDWQTSPDYNYRHIDRKTLLSNSGDIFSPESTHSYLGKKIFLFLRKPEDRLISEFFFIKDRSEFIGQLKPVPSDLKQYVNDKRTANYMCKFLLGWKMYDKRNVEQKHLDQILESIDKLNIKVGLFEEYDRSLDYFAASLGMKFPNSIDKKRVTLNRPGLNDIKDSVKALIVKRNHMDQQLYEACLSRFRHETSTLKRLKSYTYKGDEYDYILKYTERFSLLNLASDNQGFQQNNAQFFDELNRYLHFDARITEGHYYVINWIRYVSFSIKIAFQIQSGNPEFLETLSEIEDPLDRCKALSRRIKKHVPKNTDLGRFSPLSIRLERPSKFSSIKKKIFGS